MRLNFKKLDERAITPDKCMGEFAGLNLYALDYDFDFKYWKYRTGISVEIPEGYIGMVFPNKEYDNLNLKMRSVNFISPHDNKEIEIYYEELDEHASTKYYIGDVIGRLIVIQSPALELYDISDK